MRNPCAAIFFLVHLLMHPGVWRAGCKAKLLKTFGPRAGSKSAVIELGGKMALTSVLLNFTQCACKEDRSITVETSRNGQEFHVFQYAQGFSTSGTLVSKNVFGHAEASHIRINGTKVFALSSVGVFGGCMKLPSATTAPGMKGNRLRASGVKGEFRNPQVANAMFARAEGMG